MVRFGKADEKISWSNKLTELFLIETTSYGGNGGAPVFASKSPSADTQGDMPVFKLAGIFRVGGVSWCSSCEK